MVSAHNGSSFCHYYANAKQSIDKWTKSCYTFCLLKTFIYGIMYKLLTQWNQYGSKSVPTLHYFQSKNMDAREFPSILMQIYVSTLIIFKLCQCELSTIVIYWFFSRVVCWRGKLALSTLHLQTHDKHNQFVFIVFLRILDYTLQEQILPQTRLTPLASFQYLLQSFYVFLTLIVYVFPSISAAGVNTTHVEQYSSQICSDYVLECGICILFHPYHISAISILNDISQTLHAHLYECWYA